MTILNEMEDPGSYSKHFETLSLPIGSYLIRITIGKEHSVKRMEIVR